MIRTSPAENYFKYLVTHPKTYENAYIKTIAEELGLDYLGDWYIQSLRRRVRPPAPFYPEERTHLPSQRFLMKEGLLSVYLPDKHMQEALRILARARVRELVETMILSGAPTEAIAHAVRTRSKLRVGKEAIRLFRYYFWNIDLLDSLQMRALLEMRNSGAFMDTQEDAHRRQVPALNRFRHTDPRAIAARLPSSPLSALAAQMELGALPRKLDLGHVIEQTRQAAVIQTFLAVQSGGPMGSQMGQGYAMIADVMNRLKADIVNPEDELREELRKISVATTKSQIPTMKSLTGGNHTTSLQPEPRSKDEEVVTTGESVDDNSDG